MGVDVGAGATYSFETLLYIEQLHSANSNIESPPLCQGLLPLFTAVENQQW